MPDFFVMPQYASLRGKLVLKTSFCLGRTFRHCLCYHKQCVHIICSKREPIAIGCKSLVKTQTKAVRFFKTSQASNPIAIGLNIIVRLSTLQTDECLSIKSVFDSECSSSRHSMFLNIRSLLK